MPDGEAEAYNTLHIMKVMARNMMNGTLAQKWVRQMPLIDWKKRMGQRFETHTIFLSGEGCKSATRLMTLPTDITIGTAPNANCYHNTLDKPLTHSLKHITNTAITHHWHWSKSPTIPITICITWTHLTVLALTHIADDTHIHPYLPL